MLCSTITFSPMLLEPLAPRSGPDACDGVAAGWAAVLSPLDHVTRLPLPLAWDEDEDEEEDEDFFDDEEDMDLGEEDDEDFFEDDDEDLDDEDEELDDE